MFQERWRELGSLNESLEKIYIDVQESNTASYNNMLRRDCSYLFGPGSTVRLVKFLILQAAISLPLSLKLF